MMYMHQEKKENKNYMRATKGVLIFYGGTESNASSDGKSASRKPNKYCKLCMYLCPLLAKKKLKVPTLPKTDKDIDS